MGFTCQSPNMVTINQIWIYERIVKLIRDSFNRYFRAFRMIPIPLAIFPEIYAIWSFQDNLLSTITPRNFDFTVSEMDSPSILILIESLVFLKPENSINWVFLMFKDSLLALSHSIMLSNSVFIVCSKWLIFLPLIKRLLSSANSTGNVLWHICGKSFMYTRNNTNHHQQRKHAKVWSSSLIILLHTYQMHPRHPITLLYLVF